MSRSRIGRHIKIINETQGLKKSLEQSNTRLMI